MCIDGPRMTHDEFAALVAAGETPGVEFKNARARTDNNFWEVAKAALGMVNRRDGGLIFVGVENNGNIQGLSVAQIAEWQDVDAVRQKLAPYADPFLYVSIEIVAASANAGAPQCAVINVQEFDLTPVLCNKAVTANGGQEVLKLGGCYIRSRQVPSTTLLADHAAFRELLDLAVDKGVREFVRRTRQAELGDDLLAAQELFRRVIEAGGIAAPAQPAPQDQDRFRAQREGAFDE